jgi:hypothetical protein
VTATSVSAGLGSTYPAQTIFSYTNAYAVVAVDPTFFKVHLFQPFDVNAHLLWNFASATNFGIYGLASIQGVNNTASINYIYPKLTGGFELKSLSDVQAKADGTLAGPDLTHWYVLR